MSNHSEIPVGALIDAYRRTKSRAGQECAWITLHAAGPDRRLAGSIGRPPERLRDRLDLAGRAC